MIDIKNLERWVIFIDGNLNKGIIKKRTIKFFDCALNSCTKIIEIYFCTAI